MSVHAAFLTGQSIGLVVVAVALLIYVVVSRRRAQRGGQK